MSNSRVQLGSVSMHYGRLAALKAIDLVLNAGECVGLVGHNGAGKSTLIKLILGLMRPTAGSIQVFDVDPASLAGAALRRRIGYLPENLSLHPSLTGHETLAFYGRLKGVSTRPNPDLLARVGLADAARRRVGTYSKGMRQRLGLAQALLGEPTLLLLDEPTTGLDPALRLVFYETVRELRDRGATILISSHALAELQEQVDRVVMMNHGHKVADGTIAELRRLAHRPLRIRLTLANADRDGRLDAWAERVGASARWCRVSKTVLEACCDEAEKMRVIEMIAASPGAVKDIEVISPSLDETYAHFLQREAAE